MSVRFPTQKTPGTYSGRALVKGSPVEFVMRLVSACRREIAVARRMGDNSDNDVFNVEGKSSKAFT